MFRSRSSPAKAFALIAVAGLIAGACAASPSPTPTAAGPTPTPAPTASSVVITSEPLASGQPGPNGGVVVRWFIGLGAGTQPAQIGPEQAFATAYNASQKDVYLSPEIIGNQTAAQILKTELSSPASAPDIVGPVGIEGLNLFRDQLLDLAPLVTATGYTQPGVDPKLSDFFKIGAGGAQIGLPFAVYPSFLFYNQALFDEANLPYPPTKVGDTYDGKPWDVAALRALAMKLTVDSNGNDATSSSFDATKVVQWGFDSQYQDNNTRAETSFFGAGLPVAADGKTAQIPAAITAGAKWFNDGVWTDHFIPNANQIASDLLAQGSEFASGNLAMNIGHTWFTCCVTPAKAKPFKFGFAVLPTVNGTITSALHTDTFSILKTTRVPDAAFKALTAMVASPELLTTYGAMPADASKQQAWFDSIDAGFPGITLDWSIPQAMLAYPDIPNHQAYVPNYAEARAAFQAFYSKYRTTSGLNIDTELATLQTTLQGIYDKPVQ
jgi:multiple sugar transport system substrate-binding protein